MSSKKQTIEERLEALIVASRGLATEADMYACGEGDRDALEEAIEEVERLTGLQDSKDKGEVVCFFQSV